MGLQLNIQTLKVAFIDLNHMTKGIHTNTVPLSSGLIAKYFKQNIHIDTDIKIFKNPYKFLECLDEWKPDILALAQYLWNSNLNLYFAQRIKTLYPNTMIIIGGPNQYLTSEERLEFLKHNRFIDVCVAYDGEIPFLNIVKRRINGESIEEIRNTPSPGTYSLDSKEELVESTSPTPRIDSLNVFGAIYAEGFMDSFLNDGFHPFLQTHRGCPFKCSYCHTSNHYYNKMLFQSENIFRQDMEYLGSRYKGHHQITLYLGNTNFSLFNEDFEIAKVIREIQDKYDWPKVIDVTPGKDPDKLLKLLSMLKYKFTPAISLQTLTPKVLTNINRKNISLDDFSTFHKKIIREVNQNTGTELILNLPGETKNSFINTVEQVLNSGVQNIVIYSLMSLRGTPISSLQTIKDNDYTVRYRVVPRAFSEIDGHKIFDTEEVVVASKDMSFEDYLHLRGLAIIITVFVTSVEFFPIRKFIMEYKLAMSEWVFNIHNDLLNNPYLISVYGRFIQETKDELFNSNESLYSFFNEKGNYQSLLVGKLGDNLLRKYKTIFLLNHYKECLNIAFSVLKKIVDSKSSLEQLCNIINEIQLFLESRDVGQIFANGYDLLQQRKYKLQYDVPKWLSSSTDNSLEKYRGHFIYKTVITQYMKDRLISLNQMNKSLDLSIQILYRDGYISDFWPKWINITNEKNMEK